MERVCKKCGNNLYGNKSKCPFCGAPIRGTSPVNENRVNSPMNYSGNENSHSQNNYNYQNTNVNHTDTGSFGWFILGFCLPVVGIIVGLLLMSSKPNSAKSAFLGAVIMILLGIFVSLFNAVSI